MNCRAQTHLLAGQPAGRQLLEELYIEKVKAVLSVAVQDLRHRREAAWDTYGSKSTAG